MKFNKWVVLCASMLLLATLAAGTEESSMTDQEETSSQEVSRDLRSCPNSCSYQGTCQGSTCVCYYGWAGIDCSIRDIALSSGVPVNHTVTTYSWDYYHIYMTNTGGGLLFVLNQTSLSGDCDLYVYYGDYPTRSRYTLRDTGTAPNLALSVQYATSGTWYVGVFGFAYCTYTLTVTITSSCPNGCSGHGSCYGSQCTCYPPWSGADCSVETKPLLLNVPKNNQVVGLQQWAYYVIHFTSGNRLKVTMVSTTNTDCDLYMRYNYVPTTYNYDYDNTTSGATSTIIIPYAWSGYWYVGVYGYAACTFNIVANGQTNCPNQCSAHGNCAGGSICTCSDGYVGNMCETYNSSTSLGTLYTGFLDTNAWNYYYFNADTAANLVVQVQQLVDNSSDCDLYVRRGQKPDLLNYDKHDEGQASNYSLVITNPGAATWWVGIYGYFGCTYNLWFEVNSDCPKGCANGVCQGGVCVCNSGWTGETCNVALAALVSNTPVTNSLVKNTWSYYGITAPGALYIDLKEKGSKGLAWLFVSAFTFPTLRNHDYSDQQTNTAYHRLTIVGNSTTPTQYVVGVYGSPYIIANVTYSIVAWASPFRN